MKPTTKKFLIIGAVVVLAIVAIILAFSLTGPEEVPYLNSDKTSATLEGMYKSGRVAAFSVEGNYKVKILLNGAEKYDAQIVDGVLKLYVAQNANYASGPIRLQVQQNNATPAVWIKTLNKLKVFICCKSGY